MSKQYFNSLTRSIVVLGLIAASNPLGLSPAFAAPTAPNVTIDNQATGTFEDLDDTSTGPQNVVSNVVSVTVEEVAGISIVSSNIPTAPVNGIANFDFTIKNIGNDPTKFFLPSTLNATKITGGNQSGVLQIVSYVPAGSTTPVVLGTPLDVNTAGDTNSLSDPTLGGNTTFGSIPADAAIVVRVKVNVTAAAGSPVSVVLGDTPTVGDSNIDYTAGTNDVYTVDNPDNSTVSGEAVGTPGTPINGVREASATRSVNAISSGTDYGDAPSDLSSIDASLNPAYPTLSANNGASHSLNGTTYLGAGVSTEANGQPTANADGDTQDDGVTFPTIGSSPVMLVGQFNTISVNASTAGVLNAWIDWNQDGQWDSSEQIALNRNLTAGNNTITVNPLNTSPHGKTYARFRFSSQSNLQPTGAAIDGEVEDYAINLAMPGINQCTAPLLNGGFEAPITSSSSPAPLQVFVAGKINAYKEADVPGWATIATNPSAAPSTTPVIISDFNKRNAIEIWNTASGTTAYTGNQFAEINAYTLGKLYQDLTTTPGVTIRWQFAHRGRNGNDTIRVLMGVPGATVSQGTYTTGNTAWKVYSGTYTIPAGQDITRFEFEAVSTASTNAGEGNFIDDIQFGVDCPQPISGTVFEDPNYGGGAGRPFSTPTTSARPNARVELYDATGAFKGFAITDSAGAYTFDSTNVVGGVFAGDYKVRVVNSTVTSSRPGSIAGLLPVQTFRTDAITGTVTNVTNRVGGEKPAEVDAPANITSANLSTLDTATEEVQSITTVKVVSGGATEINFGYNFDTIVNTNDIGQGSLRQFVTNSNTLLNTGLTQVGQTAGQEVSIFMIPNGTARPGLSSTYATGLNGTGGNANAAVIALNSQLVITDNNTSIDARTQTTNVSNSNAGTVGTGGTVGTDGLTLDVIPKPEVVLDFSTMSIVNGTLDPTGGGSNAIVIQGQNTALAGFAFYGYKISQGLAGLNKGMVWVTPSVTDAGKTILTQLFGGTLADGTKPPVNSLVGSGIQTSGGAEISNSYFAYLADAADFENINGTKAKFFNNELAFNGPQTTSGIDMSGLYADQLETGAGSKNITVSGNLVRNSNKINATNAQGQGIQISNSTFVTVENNSFIDNNIFGINVSASDSLIQKNIVTGTKNGPGFTQGSGIIVYYGDGTGVNNRISQNSTFDNVKLGIDHQIDGVTPNDGLKNPNQPNNGMDYPIITSSSVSGGTLTVKGYVGNVATGSPTFGGATIEFFVGASDTNDKGKVFSTDPATVSKLHAEGQTYLGSCTTDASGLFGTAAQPCNFIVPANTSPTKITATATDAAGNTSEFSASNIDPRLLLVKRITAINGSTNTTNGDNLANYLQDDANPYDDNTIETTLAPSMNFPVADTTFWPGTTAKTSSNFLLGGMNGGNIKPKDVIEYTIYFLSSGDSTATNVLFCDRVPANVTFMPTAFDSALFSKAPGGVTESRGILTQLNGSEASYTNVADGDAARYFPAGSDPKLVYPKVNCGGTNDNGAVVVDLGSLPNATDVGTPGSYGFVRFRGRVK